MRGRLVVSAVLVATGVGACNVVGPAIMLAHGEAKTPAAFTLPAKMTGVVFVDDRRSFLPRRNLRLVIAESATQRLLENKALTTMVEARAALGASAGDQPGQLLEIVALGQAVNADLVIYATVDGFSLTPDRVTYSPAAKVRVKVIQSRDNKGRLWPEDLRGESLVVDLGAEARDAPTTPAGLVEAENRLGAEIGRRIAELFYEHETYRKISDR
jgi:hypothetical protein